MVTFKEIQKRQCENWLHFKKYKKDNVVVNMCRKYTTGKPIGKWTSLQRQISIS